MKKEYQQPLCEVMLAESRDMLLASGDIDVDPGDLFGVAK